MATPLRVRIRGRFHRGHRACRHRSFDRWGWNLEHAYDRAVTQRDSPSDATPHPAPGPPTALPSVRARAIAFASIIVAGMVGGAVGYWFMLLQCTGRCAVPSGIGMTIGTLVGSVGAAVVCTFALRMLPEWSADRDRTIPT